MANIKSLNEENSQVNWPDFFRQIFLLFADNGYNTVCQGLWPLIIVRVNTGAPVYVSFTQLKPYFDVFALFFFNFKNRLNQLNMKTKFWFQYFWLWRPQSLTHPLENCFWSHSDNTWHFGGRGSRQCHQMTPHGWRVSAKTFCDIFQVKFEPKMPWKSYVFWKN
jgi:hypothetical protein